MTIEELEQEVSRLRNALREKSEKVASVEARIVILNEHHTALVQGLDDVETDVRALTKSVRWLLAKARGEEESL